MSRSGFAAIGWGRNAVDWACSDSTVFEWVLAEVAKMVSGCKIEKYAPKHTFVEPFHATIKKLRGPEYEVVYWIMKQLCEKGWEPFAAYPQPSADDWANGFFYLRLAGRAD